MSENQQCIDTCNSLLRGELSAVETYDQAIEKFEGDPSRSELLNIRNEHKESVTMLRQHLAEMGARPAESSGAWGSFAQAVEGAAKVLGESPALAVLEQGEEHGANEYREALEDSGVMESIKQQIRSKLLPRQESHIATLKAIRNR